MNQQHIVPADVDHGQPGRDVLDRYYTPDRLARACVETLTLRPGERILEPSAGGGAFLRALGALPIGNITAIDINPAAPARRHHPVIEADFVDHVPERLYDWVIGNPPYGRAEDHIRHALTISTSVAFLLRLAFLESASRRAFWAGPGNCLRSIHVLAQRPSFTGGGTDSAAYGWFVWQSSYSGPATIVPCWAWR